MPRAPGIQRPPDRRGRTAFWLALAWVLPVVYVVVLLLEAEGGPGETALVAVRLGWPIAVVPAVRGILGARGRITPFLFAAAMVALPLTGLLAWR